MAEVFGNFEFGEVFPQEIVETQIFGELIRGLAEGADWAVAAWGFEQDPNRVFAGLGEDTIFTMVCCHPCGRTMARVPCTEVDNPVGCVSRNGRRVIWIDF